MQVMVDRNGCIGCELCVEICPEVFRMAEDGKAEPVDLEIPGEAEETAGEAEDECPVGVITIL
jgi:ferredoxin